MYWLAFGILQALAGAVAGWWFQSWTAALAAALAAAWLWWLVDVWQGVRFFRWVKHWGLQRSFFFGIWAHMQFFWQRQARKSQKVQRTLEKELADLQAALHASPTGVLLVDEAWQIVWFNSVAAEHFGLRAPADVGQTLTNLVRSPDFNNYCEVGNFTMPLEMQGRGSHALMRERPQLSLVVKEYGDGQRLLLSQDISLLQKNDAMRRDFVANVSHEIRTPLTIFAGFVETLQTLPLSPDEQKRYLDMMAQQTGRMQVLVQDLLTLSRLEASPVPGLQEAIDVRTLLQRCRDEAVGLSAALAPDANEAVHRITVLYAQAGQKAEPLLPDDAEKQEGEGGAISLGQVLAAEKELLSAVTNLVSNAVRYTPAGGAIELAWRWQADGSARFSVRDTGPGIAAEHVPRLTERFYRVDRSRSRETGGTGLGLAIVKHVIQRHGGRLQVESTLGKGSTFTLELPAVRLRTAEALEQARQERFKREQLASYAPRP